MPRIPKIWQSHGSDGFGDISKVFWTNTTSLKKHTPKPFTNRLLYRDSLQTQGSCPVFTCFFLNDGSAHLKMWLGKQERKHLFPRFFTKNLLCCICWNIHDIPHSKWVDNMGFVDLGESVINHREIHPLWPPIAESEGINPTETTWCAQTRRFF